jgi:hypothetical protein
VTMILVVQALPCACVGLPPIYFGPAPCRNLKIRWSKLQSCAG